MIRGRDTRELTEDMNVQKTRVQQPNSIPLSPVKSPNPSGFGDISRYPRQPGILETLVGAAAPIVAQYQQEKQQRDLVEGEIARNQGMAYEEAQKKGKNYGAGWIVADLKLQADQLYLQELQKIRAGAYEMTPQDYSAHLSQLYTDMTSGLPDSPPIRKAMATLGTDLMGKLGMEQAKSRIDFDYEKSKSTIGQMITTSFLANPEQSAEDIAGKWMDYKAFGLAESDHYDMLLDSATHLREMGDGRLLSALSDSSRVSPLVANAVKQAANPDVPGILGSIAFAESSHRDFGDDGGILQGPIIYKKDGTPRMHNGEIDRARGRYQVMRSTFYDPGTRKRLGLPPEGNFDSVQEVTEFGEKLVSYNTINQGGIPGLVALSHISGSSFVDNHVNRGMPDPRLGQISVHDFIRNATGPDHPKLLKERLDYVMKVEAEFERTALDQLKKEEGVWANTPVNTQQLERLRRGEVKMMENAHRKDVVTQSLKEGTATNLSARDQLTALEIIKEESAQQIRDTIAKGADETEQDYLGRVAEDYARLYRTKVAEAGIVDKEAVHKIQNILNPSNMFHKSGPDKGLVTDEAAAALQELSMIDKVSSPSYTAKYIPKETKEILNQALSFVDSNAYDHKMALARAVEMVEKKESGDRPIPKFSDADIDTALKGRFDRFAAGWWDKALPDWAQRTKNPEASLMAGRNFAIPKQLIKDRLQGDAGDAWRNVVRVRAEEEYYMSAGRITPEAAIRQATADVEDRTLMLMGTPLVVPKGVDRAAWLGLEGTEAKLLETQPGLATLAIAQIIREENDYSRLEGLTNTALAGGQNLLDAVDLVIGGTGDGARVSARVAAGKAVLQEYRDDLFSDTAFGDKYWADGRRPGLIGGIQGTAVPGRGTTDVTARGVPRYDDFVFVPNFSNGTVSVYLTNKEGGTYKESMIISGNQIGSMMKNLADGSVRIGENIRPDRKPKTALDKGVDDEQRGTGPEPSGLIQPPTE